MKNIIHLLSYLLVRATSLILAVLSLGFAYLLARVIGNFAYHVLQLRRQVVMDNLHTAFGREMQKSQLEKIAAESYRQISMSFIELMIGPKLTTHIQHMLEPEHIELIQELMKQGKGLIIVSGHLGCWELQGAAAATALAEPLTVAAAKQSNPYIDRFVTERRSGMGMQVAGTKEAMKLLLKALRKGQALGLAADQNAGRGAVFVDFFGKATASQPGPAKLALKFNVPMLVGGVIRTGPAQFRVLLQQVEIKKDDTIATITQKHVKILEGFIRQYPEQYFWLHRRWKTRPKEETEKIKG
jgi:KDO2-lipid IV(A) lauroyltransferase